MMPDDTYRLALAAELASDPAGIGYAGMTDAAALAALTAATRTRNRAVASTELLAWGGASGRIERLQRVADDTQATDAARSVCRVALLVIQRDGTEFAPDNPAHMALLNGLVAMGALTSVSDPQDPSYPGDKESLLALATEQVSRAAEIGIPDGWLTEHRVAVGRAA